MGNTWCAVLHPDLASITSKSLLEAALIHVRNLIEFLGRVEDRYSWQVALARDFLSTEWTWDRSDEIDQIDQLHGRLAHMGMIRSTTNFDWRPWLNRQLPVVLGAFRDFLVELRGQGTERRAPLSPVRAAQAGDRAGAAHHGARPARRSATHSCRSVLVHLHRFAPLRHGSRTGQYALAPRRRRRDGGPATWTVANLSTPEAAMVVRFDARFRHDASAYQRLRFGSVSPCHSPNVSVHGIASSWTRSRTPSRTLRRDVPCWY